MDVRRPEVLAAAPRTAAAATASFVRRQMTNELKFPANFEGLVLGCIDADFCK